MNTFRNSPHTHRGWTLLKVHIAQWESTNLNVPQAKALSQTHTRAHVAGGIAPSAVVEEASLRMERAILLPAGRDGVRQSTGGISIPTHPAPCDTAWHHLRGHDDPVQSHWGGLSLGERIAKSTSSTVKNSYPKHSLSYACHSIHAFRWIRGWGTFQDHPVRFYLNKNLSGNRKETCISRQTGECVAWTNGRWWRDKYWNSCSMCAILPGRTSVTALIVAKNNTRVPFSYAAMAFVISPRLLGGSA